MAKSLKAALTPTAPVAAYPALKASIVLFDCNPGTRNWIAPYDCTIRVFVVGPGGGATASTTACGGGYSEKILGVTAGQVISYTVGAPGTQAAVGGTSSFGGVISATGGGASAAGVGSGGDINTSGGVGHPNSGGCGAAGHAFGDGQPGTDIEGGGFSSGRSSYVDGWKLGILPGASEPNGYGVGATGTASEGAYAGLGGGGFSQATQRDGGIGGGSGLDQTAGKSRGGPGLVGIEVIA